MGTTVYVIIQIAIAGYCVYLAAKRIIKKSEQVDRLRKLDESMNDSAKSQDPHSKPKDIY